MALPDRNADPRRRRAVQDDGRNQCFTCPIAAAAVYRSDRGQDQSDRSPSRLPSIHQDRQAECVGDDHRGAAEAMPDTPTVEEFLPGFEASRWYCVGAPRNTSAEIIRP